MKSGSGGSRGTVETVSRVTLKAGGCEAFWGSKAFGTSRRSTSLVKSHTSSIGRATALAAVGNRFKSCVCIHKSKDFSRHWQQCPNPGLAREPGHVEARKAKRVDRKVVQCWGLAAPARIEIRRVAGGVKDWSAVPTGHGHYRGDTVDKLGIHNPAKGDYSGS